MKLLLTVEEQWRSYERAVLPADAGRVQRWETRRAFYAGVYSLLVLTRDVLGRPEVDDDAGAEALHRLLEECEQFKQDVQGGRK